MGGEKLKKDPNEQANAERPGQRPTKNWRTVFSKAFHELESKGWLQNIVVGLAFLLISQLAVRLFMTGLKGTIIGAALGVTVLFWILVIVIVRSVSDETPPAQSIPTHATAPSPATQDDIAEIKRQLTELYNHVKPPLDAVTAKYPGISLHAELRLHTLQESRRQYLFDLGQIDKERFSMYLDPDNVLTVALVSSKNEPYNIRVSPSDVPMEHFIFVSSEVAVRDNSTLLTVSINGTPVGRLELPFKVAPDRIDPAGAVIGADLNGQNGARFDMAESMLFSTTLTSDEFKGLLEYMRNKTSKQYVQFNGSQWLRSRGKRKGAYQDIPEAAPRLRKFEVSK